MLAHKDAYLRGQRHRNWFACSGCLSCGVCAPSAARFSLFNMDKSPILLELPPLPSCGRTAQGQQLLNTVIVSFYSRKFNDNSTKMMQFPHFSLPFLTISRI